MRGRASGKKSCDVSNWCDLCTMSAQVDKVDIRRREFSGGDLNPVNFRYKKRRPGTSCSEDVVPGYFELDSYIVDIYK